MSIYIAPIRDMQFVLNEFAGLEEICALPGNEECTVDLVESILDEASKFATGVLDPINKVGDQTGHVCSGFGKAVTVFAFVIDIKPVSVMLYDRNLKPICFQLRNQFFQKCRLTGAGIGHKRYNRGLLCFFFYFLMTH